MNCTDLLCSIINHEGAQFGNAVWATPHNLRFFDEEFVGKCVAKARPKLTPAALALLCVWRSYFKRGDTE